MNEDRSIALRVFLGVLQLYSGSTLIKMLESYLQWLDNLAKKAPQHKTLESFESVIEYFSPILKSEQLNIFIDLSLKVIKTDTSEEKGNSDKISYIKIEFIGLVSAVLLLNYFCESLSESQVQRIVDILITGTYSLLLLLSKIHLYQVYLMILTANFGVLC